MRTTPNTKRLLGGGGDTPFIRPNVSHCIEENEVHYNPIPHDYSKDYLTIVSLRNNNEIGWVRDMDYYDADTDSSVVATFDYSLDNGKTWEHYEPSEIGTSIVTTLNNGKKMLVKANNTVYAGSDGRYLKRCGGFDIHDVDVQGNIMSMLHGDLFNENTEFKGNKEYVFYRFFYNCGIVNAKNLVLPAMTLVDNCYRSMFQNCYELVSAPKLPATELVGDCYSYMFQNCYELVSVYDLPATIITYNGWDGSYYKMFENCTSLVNAPNISLINFGNSDNVCGYMFAGCTSLVNAPQLPAMILANSCYSSMFKDCTSLVNAPELPATTLAGSCYFQMFFNCTSLVNAPQLPATTLTVNCYTSMFTGCTSLTTAPELPATELVDGANGCYGGMFLGCTKLNYIKAMFTTTPSTLYTNQWVSGVAANGTFVKNSAATWNVTGVNGIPSGWTVETATE